MKGAVVRPVDLPPDLAQLHDDLDQARRAERSHYLWWVVAISPVGLLVAFGLVMEGSWALLWLAALVAAVAVQFRKWRQCEREVQRLEALLGLESDAPASEARRQGPG